LKRRQLWVIAALVAICVAGWVFVNPSARFGLSQFGVTTFNRVPVPYVDLQVRSDGAIRWVAKTHDPDAAVFACLVSSRKPEVIVVALGWQSGVQAGNGFPSLAGIKVLAVPTDEALPLYNLLKDQGVRVAIHVHSTC
jgi:hypothetical protein